MSANEKEVTPIFCPYVTLTSQASCISYLDNGVVFIGSSYGDSQLLQLSTTADPESGSHIAELDRWTNLGPIVDFVVTDLHRQGHGQVVTCSGKELDGSLRVVSNGIGMEEQARLELPGVKGMWQIRRPSAATLLVLSFVSETRVLAMAPAEEEGEPDELGEVEAPGLDSDAPSVLCATLCGGAYVVQATPTSLRLIDARSLALVDVWTPPAGASIETCAASTAHILLATGGKALRLLGVEASKWSSMGESTLPHEVACVALRGSLLPPAGSSDAMDVDDDVARAEGREGEGCEGSGCSAGEAPTLAAVGLWTDLSVLLLSLPSLQVVHTEKLGVDVIPRDILFYKTEPREYLLCALGDGQLMSWTLEGASSATPPPTAPPTAPLLRERKCVALGTQPISLVPFSSGGVGHVFACSDRPSVIHATGGSACPKLLYSSVNLREASHMTAFDAGGEGGGGQPGAHCTLAIAAEDSLIIGAIDGVQRLHVRTEPLGEQPRRLAHAPAARAFGVLTVSAEYAPSGEVTERGFVRLLDDQTFERLSSFELEPQEIACSILHTGFSAEAAAAAAAPAAGGSRAAALSTSGVAGASKGYLVVGTALEKPEERETCEGRILVFELSERGFRLAHERIVRGAVYSLESLGPKLLAGVNNKLQLYGWEPAAVGGQHSLQLYDEHCGHILVLYVHTRGVFFSHSTHFSHMSEPILPICHL